MKQIIPYIVILLLVCAGPLHAQSFDAAAAGVKKQLDESLAELAKLREQMAAEKIPLSRQLSELENDLVNVRLEFQQTSRLLDTRTLDLTNLRGEIKTRQDEAGYLANLLSEYNRNFESGLHIAELQRYHVILAEARLARENDNLSEEQIFQKQAELFSESLERLHDVLGGTQFKGKAVDPSGTQLQGTFVLIGPVALFRSSDGNVVGTSEQRLGSLEPSVIPFGTPEDTQAASSFIADGKGNFTLDPTLGSAHKVESTDETLWEHIGKGGPVMWPILGLAAAAALVVLYKWLAFTLVRKPSQRRIDVVLAAIAQHDKDGALKAAHSMGGPVGRMLRAGLEHLGRPRELVEEAMYEIVISSRLKLQRMLPFLAISTSSAPLLGLLGTVTGIITTFKLITVYGSGDVKTLSSGISEALITTEWGLIVAIPSLLFHAMLTRKMRGIVDQMEKTAVAVLNQISKSEHVTPAKAA